MTLVYVSGSSPNSFICQIFDDSSLLETLMEGIAEYIASQDARSPKEAIMAGDILLAKCSEDNLWYRAEVLSCDASTDTARVLLVDYGSTDVIPCADTCAVPHQFTTLCRQANTFRLASSSGEEWSGDTFAKFETLAKNCRLIATVLDQQEHCVLVSLKSENGLDFAENIQ